MEHLWAMPALSVKDKFRVTLLASVS